VLLKRKGIAFDTKLKDVLKIDKKVLTSIFAMALPLMLNEALWSSGQTMFMQAYSMRGEYAFAAQNITGAISQLVFVTFGGVATGIAVLVGNTLGRNELEEAKENARKLIAFAVFFAACMGVLLFILSFFVLDIYKVAEETKRIAQFNIRVNALFIPVYSFNVALYFTLRSGGDTKSTLLMDSVYMWVVAVPIAFVMSRFTNWPVTIMFLLVQVTDIPKGLFGLSRYRKGYWIKNLAKNEEKVIVKT
jgi:Na+-driven multidrug efflux pump